MDQQLNLYFKLIKRQSAQDKHDFQTSNNPKNKHSLFLVTQMKVKNAYKVLKVFSQSKSLLQDRIKELQKCLQANVKQTKKLSEQNRIFRKDVFKYTYQALVNVETIIYEFLYQNMSLISSKYQRSNFMFPQIIKAECFEYVQTQKGKKFKIRNGNQALQVQSQTSINFFIQLCDLVKFSIQIYYALLQKKNKKKTKVLKIIEQNFKLFDYQTYKILQCLKQYIQDALSINKNGEKYSLVSLQKILIDFVEHIFLFNYLIACYEFCNKVQFDFEMIERIGSKSQEKVCKQQRMERIDKKIEVFWDTLQNPELIFKLFKRSFVSSDQQIQIIKKNKILNFELLYQELYPIKSEQKSIIFNIKYILHLISYTHEVIADLYYQSKNLYLQNLPSIVRSILINLLTHFLNQQIEFIQRQILFRFGRQYAQQFLQIRSKVCQWKKAKQKNQQYLSDSFKQIVKYLYVMDAQSPSKIKRPDNISKFRQLCNSKKQLMAFVLCLNLCKKSIISRKNMNISSLSNSLNYSLDEEIISLSQLRKLFRSNFQFLQILNTEIRQFNDNVVPLLQNLSNSKKSGNHHCSNCCQHSFITNSINFLLDNELYQYNKVSIESIYDGILNLFSNQIWKNNELMETSIEKTLKQIVDERLLRSLDINFIFKIESQGQFINYFSNFLNACNQDLKSNNQKSKAKATQKFEDKVKDAFKKIKLFQFEKAKLCSMIITIPLYSIQIQNQKQKKSLLTNKKDSLKPSQSISEYKHEIIDKKNYKFCQILSKLDQMYMLKGQKLTQQNLKAKTIPQMIQLLSKYEKNSNQIHKFFKIFEKNEDKLAHYFLRSSQFINKQELIPAMRCLAKVIVKNVQKGGISNKHIDKKIYQGLTQKTIQKINSYLIRFKEDEKIIKEDERNQKKSEGMEQVYFYYPEFVNSEKRTIQYNRMVIFDEITTLMIVQKIRSYLYDSKQLQQFNANRIQYNLVESDNLEERNMVQKCQDKIDNQEIVIENDFTGFIQKDEAKEDDQQSQNLKNQGKSKEHSDDQTSAKSNQSEPRKQEQKI